MVNGLHLTTSKFDNEVSKIKNFSSLKTGCRKLKAKWMANLHINHPSLSNLTSKILKQEISSQLEDSSVDDIESLTILERLQIQRKNSIYELSNFILNPTPFNESIAEETTLFLEIKKPQLLQELRDKGYESLAKILEKQTGYPWEEIEKIRSPLLIEQLTDIYFLCQHKYGNNQEHQTQKVIDFALQLAQLATSSNLNSQYMRSYELIDEAKHVLGELIFLIDRNPQLALDALKTSSYKEALENLKNKFNCEIQTICHRLQKHYSAHHKTLLQSPDLALSIKIPIEIAKALLTENGIINVGIIDILSHVFLPHTKQPINHEVNLSYALNLLQRSPKLRSEFSQIHRPISDKLASNEVIRASLGLLPRTRLTDRDASLVALIALLSHLRQGEDGSCFAVSLAIEILSAHLNFCLHDLRQLLQEGKLTRTIQGVCKDIPFIKHINDEDLNKTIIFDQQGYLIINDQKQAFLWKAPGLCSACQALGIKNSKKAIETIIQQLPFPSENNFYAVEIKILIQQLCKYAKTLESPLQHLSLRDLYYKACFAFSSQTSQPLLEVWKNAIANMAEAEEGSMIKTAILESVLDALQFKLGELDIPPSLFLQRFFLLIQKILNENIQLCYDPLIEGQQETDQPVKGGGFVLHHQHQQINNEKAFRSFIQEILLQVHHCMHEDILSDPDHETDPQELTHILDILTPYIDSVEFMGYLLARYKLTVSQLSRGQIISHQQSPFTPWITPTGSNSKSILNIYFEMNQYIPTERFIPSGAEEALIHIIDMCKHMSEEEKMLYLNNPNKLKPFRILGKHRLPFMAGHPSLANAWQQECPTKEWIESYVIKPGKEIAETIIDPEMQQRVIQYLQIEVFPILLSKAKIATTLELMHQIPSQLTIKDYRQQLLHIYQNINLPHRLSLEKLARQIDTTLCQFLPSEERKKLEESAVHFADTNWCNGIQDIHFCFAVNPGTGKLELWEANANGSHLIAIDQNYWLFNQKWEFLTIPDEIAPDDATHLTTETA